MAENIKVLDMEGLTYLSNKIDKELENIKEKLENINLADYCTKEEIHEVVTNLRIVQTEYVYTTPSTMMVSFTVPAYTTDGMTVMDVFINGLICVPNVDYTMSGNTVNMTKQLGPEQVCYFIVRSISVRGDDHGQ